MRTIDMATQMAKAALLIGGALSLVSCEIRQEAGEADADSAQEAEAETGAEPTPAASTSAVSIIREDLVPEEPVVKQVDPIELVIPFPDGPDLTLTAERVLVGALESGAMRQGWPVVIAGHTDSSGNDQANLRASRSRAEAVAAWLVEHGVADERIEVIAFGEQNPIAPNARPDGSPDEQGRRSNRRVELRIAPPAPSAVSTERPAIRTR